MERRFALTVLATLVLIPLVGSLTLPAAGDVAKPGTIVTVAGTGSPGYSGDNGPATQALLNGPWGLALDAAGNLYIADVYNSCVRKVDAVTGIITTVAGTGKPGFSGDGGKATDAQLKPLGAVVVDGAGNLFIADLYNHRVRKVAPDGMITTYAGSGPVDAVTPIDGDARNGGFSGDNGPAMDARLNGPGGLAVDAHGNLFIADYYNNRVRKVDAATGMISTVAGNGHPGYSGDGGQATDARLNGPVGLAVDSAGNLFIGDEGDPRVRKVTPDGLITTVAGTGTASWPLAVDSAGNLFVTDNRVRKIDAVTGIITTVAGNGKNQPYAGDGGLATETGFRGPFGLAIDAGGNLLIADHPYPHAAPYDERVVKVFGVAAPGLIAGMAFPMPKQP
jgi:sugar lactone lactonase YvrE